MNLSDIARAAGLAHGYLSTIPDTEPRPSAIHGHGLFARTALKAGHAAMTTGVKMQTQLISAPVLNYS